MVSGKQRRPPNPGLTVVTDLIHQVQDMFDTAPGVPGLITRLHTRFTKFFEEPFREYGEKLHMDADDTVPASGKFRYGVQGW